MGQILGYPLIAENAGGNALYHPAQDGVSNLMPILTDWIEANARAVAPQLEGFESDPEAAIAEAKFETVVDIISWLSDTIGSNVILLRD